MLNISIHINPSIPWHKRWVTFFLNGFKKHDIDATVTSSRTRLPNCDIAILFGPNAWKAIENDKRPYIMVNRKFMGEEKHVAGDIVALSWDGFNGKGYHCVKDISPDRLNKFIKPDEDIKEWKPMGNTFLLCGQADIGRSTTYKYLTDWYKNVKNSTKEPIRFRSHPTQAKINKLEDDLVDVKAAITLNSLVSVEILMEGIPVITMDECSAVYGVTGHTMDDIKYPDRLKLLQHLAHCQWHYTEIIDGSFWEQLYPQSGERLMDYRE